MACGESFEQRRETAALAFSEPTTTREEFYNERQRKREDFIAGMETRTILFVPRGVSQATAWDGSSYQIPADGYICHREFCQNKKLDLTSTRLQ